jgi:ketosteroid isomerase-like protein
MKTKELFKLVLIGASLMGITSAYAQDAANDQADVWTAIEGEWDAQEKGEKNWADELLTEDFTGWSKNSPAPRSRSSTKMWNRVNDMMGEMVAHELYPLSIVVHGDVAIAHYLYRSAFKSKEGDIEMANGRYTDILVRTENGWKFLSWHGGKD